MKILKLLIVICFAATALSYTPSAAAAKITKESLVSEGRTRTYYLLLPDKLSASKPLPLIVLLHGSKRNGLSLVEKWKDLAAKEEIILAGPDSSDSVGWSVPEDGPDFLRDLVEALKANYPVNPRRVYLFGHSAGAGHAIYMSLFESQYFAATAIHAGALPEQGYVAIEKAKRKIPLAIWVGTVDPFFPLKLVRATRDAMNAQGFSVQLTEMPGHDHWYYDLAPKINKEAWEFLKKQELTEDPKYVKYYFGG
ncbi:MAG TPA: alpha/beta hydrolase-fold protein [Pyrinomonadaceae bacterium]